MSLLSRLKQWLRPTSHESSAPQPEHAFIVTSDDEFLRCSERGKEDQVLRWRELIDIKIVTNDEGPLLPDVFWIFRSSTATVVFPQGALGEKTAMDRAMSLPGFDMEMLSEAMKSTDNAEFPLWKCA